MEKKVTVRTTIPIIRNEKWRRLKNKSKGKTAQSQRRMLGVDGLSKKLGA